MHNYYDAVVVGLGGVGSFALRSLIKQSSRSSGNGRRPPLKFLGIERFNLGGHSYGSSHGRTRIYRRAYFENENYVPWIEYSIKEFRQLEIEHNNISLLNECGLLTIAAAPTTITDDNENNNKQELPPLLKFTKKSADMHNIPIEILSNSDLRRRYPQLQYKDSMIGTYEPTAGYLRPELILQTVHHHILGSSNDNNVDVTIMENTQVLDIIIQPGGSTTTTGTDENDDDDDSEYVSLKVQQQGGKQQQQEIKARCVLISAGAWSGHLLPRKWQQHLKVTRQIQSWIDVSGSADEPSSSSMYDPSNLPCWFMETPDSSIPIYGVPYDPQTTNPNERSWMKVGCHGRNAPLLDPSTNPTTVSASEMLELQHAVRHSLSEWSGSGNNNSNDEVSFVETQPCMYTMTPDHHYIIGSPMRRTFCVAGLSGHGFKMIPALGRMMADYYYALVQQQQQQQQQQQGNDNSDDVLTLLEKKWNFGFCSPDRFDR